MKYNVPMGKGEVSLDIPDCYNTQVLLPKKPEFERTGADEVLFALKSPICSPRLKDIVKKGEKVVIITSDITRPMPTYIVLPLVIEELKEAGIKPSDITVVFGLGSHRKHTADEMKKLVGENIYGTINCIDSDVDDCINLGTSKRGTPIEIFAPVVNADRRICLGNVDYHYFAGYSGGSKAILPGTSSLRTIQANHSMMVEDAACTGEVEGNPVRSDIDAVAGFVNIDFILNVVLDEKKQIIKAVAGHHIKAHRKACDYLDGIYKIGIDELADVVIVSAGGHPKDINLYQAQKALDNAQHAVKEGGTIIWLASCNEGLGDERFERWMNTYKNAKEMNAEIQRKFELGGHKAVSIAKVSKKCEILLMSSIKKESIKAGILTIHKNAQKTLDMVLKKGNIENIIVIPYGGTTLPYTE